MSEAEENHLHLIISGDLFLKDSQNLDAISCYTKAIQLKDIKTWDRVVLLPFYNNLAIAYKRQGDLQKAQRLYEEGLSIEPRYPLYYSNLFTIYKMQNRIDAAEKLLLRATMLERKDMGHFIALGELYKEKKEYKKSLNIAIECVKHFPNEYEAHLTLGNFFANMKLYGQALDPYLAAIKINPNSTRAYNNVGVVYKELGRYDESKEAYQKVLTINPNDPAVHNNLGNLLRYMDDTAGSIAHLEESIRLNPSYADAYSNLGAVYKESKAYEKAEIYYQKALTLAPQHINANFDLSLIELSRGNYSLGWKRYEYRLQMVELISKLHHYTTPIWRGQPLREKVLILQNEQGFGDNIMFIRYVPTFIELGAKVIIRTRPELVELFKSMPNVAMVCSEEDPIPEHDYYLPLLSAPYLFQTTQENIPQVFPYLSSSKPSPLIKKEGKPILKIGLVWSSSRTNKDFKNKYIGLEFYKKLFDIKGTKWYSLQAGGDADEIKALNLGSKITNLSEHLSDFSNTASIIESLDLVITTDTSVAHLCGAMNKEAWVLVPRPADWRWMQEGETTPWYKSLKIFRQDKQGSWAAVITEIEKALKKC